MCGRFTLDTTKISLKEFGVTQVHYRPPARFNIAPTTGIAVVRQELDGEREFVELRWGLIPVWTKPDSKLPLMINARAETVATITTVPNKEAAAVHDRMPVILREEQLQRWMEPEPLPEEERQSFLEPLPEGSLKCYPVDRRAGSIRHDDPGLIVPIPA